jgi:hypothetical protein
MAGSDDNRGRHRIPGAEDRDGRTGRVLSRRVIKRSGGTVCSLHRARGDKESEFLGLVSKPRSMICQWFGLKTTRTVFSGLTSKLVAMVSPGLASKPVADFLVEH